MSEQKNLDESLLEVRKAYRLLFDYQSRILDLMSFIEGKTSFNFENGDPAFSNPSPRRKAGNLKLWAWDWLNMYYYFFHFQEGNGENGVHLAIAHMADSGFYNEKTKTHMDKINLDRYKKTENSETSLTFICSKGMWEEIGDPSKKGSWSSDEFLSKESGSKSNDNGKIIYKRYSLGRFSSEESTVEVLKDFQLFCKDKGIEFGINEGKI